jgi:hypothetical protein
MIVSANTKHWVDYAATMQNFQRFTLHLVIYRTLKVTYKKHLYKSTHNVQNFGSAERLKTYKC